MRMDKYILMSGILGGGIALCLWLSPTLADPPGGGGGGPPPPPQTMVLSGVLRDLHGSHPDFEAMPTFGFGLYCSNMSTTLGTNNKPLYVGNGWRLNIPADNWLDGSGNRICWNVAETWPAVGDVVGVKGVTNNGAINSASGFTSWFSDIPGISVSMTHDLTLTRQPSGVYLFDDTVDMPYAGLGGFFPLEGLLFGNTPAATPNRNFHFTYEVHAQFQHDASVGEFFKFTGNQTVWVYINGQLVIDLGGVGSDINNQYIDVNRLGLIDGQIYTFDLFYAQRHTPEAKMRLETTMKLISVPISTVSVVYD